MIDLMLGIVEHVPRGRYFHSTLGGGNAIDVPSIQTLGDASPLSLMV